MSSATFIRFIFIPLLILIEIILVNISWSSDLTKIANWLIGINFTLAIFSTNFTIFSYRFSKFKPLINNLSKVQWANLIATITLPFLPIIIFIILNDWYAKVALWLIPVLIYSSMDNTAMLLDFLDPKKYLKRNFSELAMSSYLNQLYNQMIEEVKKHKAQIVISKDFKNPFHVYRFNPDMLGDKNDDLWDKGEILLKISMDNNDLPVFQECFNCLFRLFSNSFSYKSRKEGDDSEIQGIKQISIARLTSIIKWVTNFDKGGIFTETIANKLCQYLRTEDCLVDPVASIPMAVSRILVDMGDKLFEDREDVVLRIITTFYLVAKLKIKKYETGGMINDALENLKVRNLSAYADFIKILGQSAIKNKKSHLLFRSVEMLSFLGCDGAKVKIDQMVISCIGGLVQLGREARHFKLGCFWERCLVSIPAHVEEYIGHIFTWLVREVDEQGKFYLQRESEEAISRLNGYSCKIVPKAGLNPFLWQEAIKDEHGKNKPHVIIHVNGSYAGKLDYSNFDDLTEYTY